MKKDFLKVVEAKRMAHVIVDVQAEFCAPSSVQGCQGTNVTARTAELIGRFADQLRDAAVPTIWVYLYNKPEDKYSPDRCRGGFYKVQPQEGDYFMPKIYNSGFQLTKLESLLEGLEISHLLLTGFYTSFCVKDTAMDGRRKGYSVSVVRDLTYNSEYGVSCKLGTLEHMQSHGIDVVSSWDVRRHFGIIEPLAAQVMVPENTLRF